MADVIISINMRGMTKSILVLKALSLLAIVVISLGIARGKLFAAPATFTVTNTNDSGVGSLRQAIIDANNNGNSSDMDTIEFNIPGSGVHTINIQTDLPAVTQKATIDGYSQPGAQENTAVSPEPINSVINIEVAATNATITQGAIGLIADGSVVKGISIYDASAPSGNLDYSNLALVGAGTSVKGSYIGLHADGSTPGQDYKNSAGAFAVGNNTIIGGTDAADRNIFYAKSTLAQSAGIFTIGTGTKIFGNYVGIAKDGVTDLTPEIADANGLQPPLTLGINLVSGGGSTVGGPGVGEKNLVSGNSANVILSSPNNVVQSNFIGTNYQGKVSSSITNGMGMTATAGSNSLVGGTGTGEGNTIAGVKGSGIEIAELTIQPIPYTLTPNKIAILGNSIQSVSPFNLVGIGKTNLGIDLSRFIDKGGDYIPDEFQDRGPTANDSGDDDTGPNGMINTPVLKTAQQVGNQLTVTYDLDTKDSPSNSYRVEFFANEASSIFGYGPGQTYLGAVSNVTSGSDKTATITVEGDVTNLALSATATAVDNTTTSGFGSTSEFAKNLSIGSAQDFDSDGAPDAVEALAPNNGDGNNDGIPDKVQPTITSYEIDSTGVYATLVTSGCSENGTVASVDVGSLNVKDMGYGYPYGMTDFSLNCSRGDTVNVAMYVHKNDEPGKYIPRKYVKKNNSFANMANATVSKQVLGESTAIKLQYSLQDGGELDDDGEANGIIVDPVGLAVESNGLLVNTGFFTGAGVFVGLLMLIGVAYTYRDYRNHKKPLAEIEPNLAKRYTYWHHLRFVSLPLVRYRFQIKIEKKQSISSMGVG